MLRGLRHTSWAPYFPAAVIVPLHGIELAVPVGGGIMVLRSQSLSQLLSMDRRWRHWQSDDVVLYLHASLAWEYHGVAMENPKEIDNWLV